LPDRKDQQNETFQNLYTAFYGTAFCSQSQEAERLPELLHGFRFAFLDITIRHLAV